ncbi:unnamed protein product, partial [Prorocentrum cordatum]
QAGAASAGGLRRGGRRGGGGARVRADPAAARAGGGAVRPLAGVLVWPPAVQLRLRAGCRVRRPMLPYVKLRDPHKRSLFNKISIFWATTLCSMFFNVEVVNPENLPAKDDPRQYMYVANHQSFMDILSVFSLRRPFKFISKSEILWIPVVGFAMKRLGHITVTRKSQRSQVHMIRTCLFQLHKGCSVFFFPEGTRTKTGRLRNFKKGAFSIAKKAKVGVVPITVLGTGDIMPAGRELRLFPSRLGVKLIVHPRGTNHDADMFCRRSARTSRTCAGPPSLGRARGGAGGAARGLRRRSEEPVRTSESSCSCDSRFGFPGVPLSPRRRSRR